MVSTAPLAASNRPPIVRSVSALIGESAAVRATVSRLSPGRRYLVRFRVRAATATAGRGCVASAGESLPGTRRVVRIGLAPRGVWCAGAGTLTVVSTRPGATAGTSRVRVAPSAAFGHGNIVGHLLLAPSCPVERIDDPCDPIARPDPVTLVALDASGAQTARTITLVDGSFALDLPSGNYTLRAEGTRGGLPSIADTDLVVTRAATRVNPGRVVVRGDTGIR
jgi:hypothetical protein